jgi:biotin/methionine sulfoxide reductase
MFGGINLKNSQVSMGGITEHETAGWFDRFTAKGMRCINVGPQRGDSPEGCEWLPLRPASDIALMMALAHVIETDDFLARCTVGFDRFLPYLMGATDGTPKSPEWAAPLCGAEPAAIRALARRMAATRTLITLVWSLQRGEHGEQPYRMSAVLAAMIGQIGLPGGGVGYGYGAIGGVGRSLLGLRGMTLPRARTRFGRSSRSPGSPTCCTIPDSFTTSTVAASWFAISATPRLWTPTISRSAFIIVNIAARPRPGSPTSQPVALS